MVSKIWFKIGAILTVVTCVAVLVIICCIATGAVYVMWHGRSSAVSGPHTITWYLSHPEALKNFEK
jgi:hypothetical protein